MTANVTGSSFQSIKEKALSQFDKYKYKNEIENVQSQSLDDLKVLYEQDLRDWKEKQISTFSFDIDDEI